MSEISYDELGSEKVLELHSAKTGITAMVVVDNTAPGPSIGGVRVSPSVNRGELLRLARTMTLKNSIAGLPHGGGKAGIIANPNDPRKELYFRIFSRQIRHLYEYISGPDMGSNEASRAWIVDDAFDAIVSRIKADTSIILGKFKNEKILPRQVAVEIAKERVLKAMRYSEC